MTTLDDRQEQRALRLAMLDGVCYAAMVGLGETSFVADAKRLGASAWEQALVIALPLALGAMGALLALAVLRRFPSRRRLTATCTAGQTVLLLLIPFADRFGSAAPAALIVAACLYQVFGQAAGTAWASWYGDLVPAAIRGAYFSRRTRFVQISTLSSQLLASLLFSQLEPGDPADPASGRGFLIVFGLAAVARAISTVTLALSPEPAFRGLPAPGEVLGFLRSGAGAAASRVLFAASGLSALVYVSSPYFAPFMLDELRFTPAEYTLAAACVVAFKVFFLPAWGKAIDHYGAHRVFILAAAMVSLVPLPWLWTEGLGWAFAVQAWSGFAWGGYEVSLFALQLGVTAPRTRPLFFAAYSLLNGGAQLLGTWIGGILVATGGGASFRLAFAVSMAGRLVIGFFARRLLPPEAQVRPVRRGEILLRVMGFRPHGGLSHRPEIEPEDPPPPK